MKIEGTFVFEGAAPGEVWNALTDPDRIAACLPGCDRLEPEAGNTYRMTMRMGIGPIRSAYSGTVELADLQPPSSYTLKVKGNGSGGFADGSGSVRIEPSDGGARVTYAGDVAVGGKIAAVGQRMVGGAARVVINQFFKCIAAGL